MTLSTFEVSQMDKRFLRRRPLYRFLAAGSIALAVTTCCVQQIWRRDGDPYVFLHAARLLLQRQDIYMTASQHGNFYYYPPFFALLNIPLTFLPEGAVIVLWSVASVALLGWSMAAFYSGMTVQPFFSLPAKTRWVVCFFATILTARFTISHLRFGQSNIFVLALAVLGLTCLSRKQNLLAGIAIALSMVVKLTTLPFGFWFLAKRRGRVLAGLVLGAVIGVMTPALIVGFDKDEGYHREWVQKVALVHLPGTGSWAGSGNISLRAQVDRFFLTVPAFAYKGRLYSVTVVELPVTVVRLIGQFAMLCIIAAIGWYALRFRDAPDLVSQWGGFAFVFSLIPNFSTVAEIPHLVLLVPAYMYVCHLWYSEIVTDRLFRILILLSFAFTSLTTRGVWGQFIASIFTSLGFVSMGILLLSVAIHRAASCIEKDRLSKERANKVQQTWTDSGSEFDAALGADAGGEGMFDFGHLGDQVGGGDQLCRSIAAGKNDMQRRLRGADSL